MVEPCLPLFVYGTLKRGQVRERCWPYSPLRVEPATIRGRLFDLGPYPALTDGERIVAGELWHIAEEHVAETLRVLDEIECYGVDDVDLYVRRVVVCTTASGAERNAYAYFIANPKMLPQAGEVEADGDGVCRWPA